MLPKYYKNETMIMFMSFGTLAGVPLLYIFLFVVVVVFLFCVNSSRPLLLQRRECPF